MTFSHALAALLSPVLAVSASAQVAVNFDSAGSAAQNWRSALNGAPPPAVQGRAIAAPAAAQLGAGNWEARLAKSNPEIPRNAVRKVLTYMQRNNVPKTNVITIIDFNKPSDQKRMYIIDGRSGKVESHLVAHGSGSGMRYAKKFSNTTDSHQSSIGLYRTAETYNGKHGRSLKLDGLDKTNSKARSRAIVIHGAKYVSDAYAKKNKRVGRSWGCPAVDMKYRDRIIDKIKGGSLLLIHHGN